MTKDKDLYNCGNSEGDEVVFRNVNGNPHTPISVKTGDVLLGDSDKSNDNKKMTPAEKIASVHIDFDRDNILPELNEKELKKIGAKQSKSVVFKKSSLYRNVDEHRDVTKKDLENIIGEALYNPIDVFPANNKKPNYFHFAAFVEIPIKNKLKMGLVLLDIDEQKDCFEIGHAYFVGGEGYKDATEKTIKKLV